MSTIYDVAMRNFMAAAEMLETLQSTRLDLVNEARLGLVGRPRISLHSGYNDITETFGACLPPKARGEVIQTEDGRGVELRCSGTDWTTLEGLIPVDAASNGCYVEMETLSDRPLTVDIFLRELLENGEARDSGHRECQMANGTVSVCRIETPEPGADVTGRRVIVHLRHPGPRVVVDRLALTMA